MARRSECGCALYYRMFHRTRQARLGGVISAANAEVERPSLTLSIMDWHSELPRACQAPFGGIVGATVAAVSYLSEKFRDW